MSRTLSALAACGAVAVLASCGDAGVQPDARDARPIETAASTYSVVNTDAQVAAIHELQSAFHGALNASDYDAIHALWTEDATLQVGPTSASGPDEIAAFFQGSGPFVNGWAALAPTYKTSIDVHGSLATFAFECVYLADTGNLTGATVVAHLNATGTMRKVGNRWLFEHFQGGAGPLP